MKNIQKVKLVPVRKLESKDRYVEMVMIYVSNYPSAIVHVDTFSIPGDANNQFYMALVHGETIDCTMTLDDGGEE